MSKRIKCATKLDRGNIHDRITHIGGDWGSVTQAQGIIDVEADPVAYYVEESGQKVYLIVSSRNGVKYLKTENDDTEQNNLLSLPNCP